MRLGQKNGTVRQWARTGARPRQPADQRYKSAYLFGAICPAEGTGAALVRPRADTQAMQAHLKPNFRTLRLAGGGKARKSWVFGARFGGVVLNDDLSCRYHRPIILTFWDYVWCPGWETRMPRHVRSRQEDRGLRVSLPRRECS